MRFEYEISAEEYVSGRALLYQLQSGRKRFKNAIGWICVGLFLFALASQERVVNWVMILLALTGAWWIYCGIVVLFPGRSIRRYYPNSEVAGNRFQADVNANGIEVADELRSWRVLWPGVRVKAENKDIFLFYSGTLFIFAKKYLTDEQQSELRRLSGLTITS